MSNRYSLNFVFVSEVEERMSVVVAVFPSKCSTPLTRASPITLPAPVPRVPVAASLSSISRYGWSISPACSGEISGPPNRLSTVAKLPTSTGVTEPA